jgi:hypothetical protein
MKEVYRIDSKETKEMVFIAAWEDAKLDWNEQVKLLEKKVHPFPALQKHFNKYGSGDLEMTIVKKVKTDAEVGKEIGKCLTAVEKYERPIFKPLPEADNTEKISETIEQAKMDEPKAEKAVMPKKVVKKKK